MPCTLICLFSVWKNLCRIINNAISEGRWKPIKLSRACHTLSHLFFADDLVLFAEALVDQINTMMECLDNFCSLSSQRVSLHESSIYFSNNVKERLDESLYIIKL